MIILPERVIPDWWREAGHRLDPADVEEVVATKPTCVVVGTGASGLMEIPPETLQLFERHGIRVIAEPTADAVATYNRLRSDGRTAACLHLTC